MHYAEGAQTAVIRVSNWEDARQIGKSLSRWLFRGQGKAEWSLKSSLERAFENIGIPIVDTKYAIEEMIIIDFKSAAHLFSTHVPKDKDTIAWLSLIRHHGGPTRLLDFTESFYVAAYFALDGATEDCAIWAFNRRAFVKRVSDDIDSLCKQFKIDHDISLEQRLDEILRRAIAGEVNNNIVITMAPSQRNERQFVQQGLAIIPLNLRNGYMGALLGSFDPPGRMPNENQMQKVNLEEALLLLQNSKLVKIVMTEDCLLDARLDLKQMNIGGATLFRGLDGLGKHSYDILTILEKHLKDRRDQTNS
ncbi:MAG: FRG domain-containing protein [Deltaproteobacteria bacterium]|nr:FRG domain-containing protein [Deltaproteobacteria bacterium]